MNIFNLTPNILRAPETSISEMISPTGPVRFVGSKSLDEALADSQLQGNEGNIYFTKDTHEIVIKGVLISGDKVDKIPGWPGQVPILTYDGGLEHSTFTIKSSVPANAKFTDTVTTVSVSGSGNAITSMSSSNGAVTAIKEKTFAEQSTVNAIQNVVNTAVLTTPNQNLSDDQKQNARANIGAIGETELSSVTDRIDTRIGELASEVDTVNNSIQEIQDDFEADISNISTNLNTITSSLNNLNNMFTLTDGVIKANYGLYTDSFISAKGLNPNSTSPVGGGSDVSWGAESDNIVPLEVDGVTKNLVLESGYEVLDGKISTKAEQEFVETGLESKQNKITERSKLDFNLIENVPDFVKGVTSSVIGLSASSVNGNVTLSLDNNRVIPTSTDVGKIQTNEDAIQRLFDSKEDKTTVERLQGAFDTFVAGFNSMFQKDGDNVKVLGGLYTDSFISAKGYNESSSVPVGGSDAEWGNASEFGIDLSVNGVSHTLLLEGAYSDLQGKISANASDVSGLQGQVEALQTSKANASDVYGMDYIDTELGNKANASDVNGLTEQVSSLESDISEVQNQVGELSTQLGDKVDSSTFSTLSQSVSNITQRVTVVETNYTTLRDTKAEKSAVVGLQNRVTNLEGLPSRVSTLEGNYTPLELRVDSLESDITLKADITSVTQVQSNLTALSEKLDSMFEKNEDGSIRVLGGLYTDSFISAKGSGGDAGVNQDVEEIVDTKIQQLEASMGEMMDSKIAAAITTALTTPV